jgi:hypothetical protein
VEDFSQAIEIGGYQVLEELNANESWRSLAPGNRQVVLKRLDPDCLLRGAGKLHPSIRDRLARVRELAHARMANLHGVERDPAWDEDAAYLVWEYVEGETLEEWAVKPEVSAGDLLLVARELILTVEALHARGIVHGAIHGRNVIIDPAGRLRLTHVSPLLYTEPRNDLDSIAALFHDLAALRGEADSPLDRLADEASEAEGLRGLSAHADVLIDARRDEGREALERAADVRRRRVSRGAAAVIVLGALILTYGVKHATNGRWNHLPPAPPRAPAAAMSP